MLTADVALIGGTGIGSRLLELGGRNILVPTIYGPMRGRYLELDTIRYVFVARHSKSHSLVPHAVPYSAIANGLKLLKVKSCLSTAAVGSLHADWSIGTLAVCSDMIDFSGRHLQVSSNSVKHTDFSSAFPLSNAMATHFGNIVQQQSVYANVNGPRFETPAEIRAFGKAGADVVGMTVGTEAIAMREVGVAYGCLAIVTNLACGIGTENLNHDSVSEVVASKSEVVVSMLLDFSREVVMKL